MSEPKQKWERNETYRRHRRKKFRQRVIGPLMHVPMEPIIYSGGLEPERVMSMVMGDNKELRSATFPLRLHDFISKQGGRQTPDSKFFRLPATVTGSMFPGRYKGPLTTQSIIHTWWHLYGKKLRLSRSAQHECPRHKKPTLRVFPAEDGEIFIRCQGCGECLPLVRHIQDTLKLPFDQTIEWMRQKTILQDPVPPDWATHHLQVNNFLGEFAKHRFAYDEQVLAQKIPYAFGDWALFDDFAFRRAMVFRKPLAGRNLKTYLVRLNRNLFGRPVSAQFFTRTYQPLFDQPLGPDRFMVTAPNWEMLKDWSRAAILCLEEETALRLQVAVMQWSEKDRLPVLWLSTCNGVPSLDNEVLKTLHIVTSPRSDLTKALSFGVLPKHRTIELSPERASEVTKEEFYSLPSFSIINQFIRRLGAPRAICPPEVGPLLDQPWVSPEAGRLLVKELCEAWKLPLGDTAREIQSAAAPLGCVIRNQRYFCLNDCYHRTKRDGPARVSNFSVIILANKPDYWLELRIGNGRTNLRISHEQFHHPESLFLALLKTAIAAGFEEPMIFGADEQKNLPTIIQATNFQI